LPFIHRLPIDLVHLIAAGEVIDSLAAAVRELVDNALDAGATRIAISVWPEHWRVRVSDNGMGLAYPDLKQAASPHSTSKIGQVADLQQITTLGFRGEALHSLAQLGQLEICSRSDEPSEGWRMTYNTQGEPNSIEPMPMAVGTIVTVDDLFVAWPSRRQNLPSLSQQLRTIQWVIYQNALCHPGVTWQVKQGERHWFQLGPAADAQTILEQILPVLRPGDLRNYQQPHLELVLGLPERCHRARPDWIYFAVNGRCVQIEGETSPDRLLAPATPLKARRPTAGLTQTLLQALQQTLPRHRYPICFVHFHVPPEQVDWNRHPAKSEIYLQHLDDWCAQLRQAVYATLDLANPNPNAAEPVYAMLKMAEPGVDYRLNRTLSSSSTPDSSLKAPLPKDSGAPSSEASTPQSTPDPPTVALSLKAVGQIHNTYIVAEHATGLWLVEQHIAHERVLYEQLLQDWQLVELMPPLILEHLLPRQVEQLQQLGISIEPFGNQLWSARSAPARLAARADCAAALRELSQSENLQVAIVATACRSAIRNGTPLSLVEMQTLLDQWQQTRQPRTCPHGRPIYLPLAETSLARFFRRHWVIGKSHGI
jgi:DNA mismatch repair protein MutL